MVLAEYIDQCKAECLARFAEKDKLFGKEVMAGFAGFHWGMALREDSENPLLGNAKLTSGFYASIAGSSDTAEVLNQFADEQEEEYGLGFVVDVVSDHYNLIVGNPNFKAGGSFDGTDKGEVAASSGTLYHLETMGSEYSQNLRKEILDNASPEALSYFPEDLDYDPVQVVDASKLSKKMWNEMRTYSIGASAIAAISGTSPFQNRLSVWHNKLHHPVLVEDSAESKKNFERICEWGHNSESYLRLLVSQQDEFAGCEIIVEPMVYSLEDHPWLTCNLDGIIKWPDGHYSVLEFKAPGNFTRDNYENNAVPQYYEEQCQMQMAEVNLDDAYLVALFDRDTFTISHIVRDLDYQMELMQQAKDFWFTNVIGEQEPEINGPGEITKNTLRMYGGKGNNKAPAITLDPGVFGDVLKHADEINTQRAALDKQSRELKKQFDAEIAPVLMQMANNTFATCEDSVNKLKFQIKYAEVEDAPKLKKADMTKMQKDNPALFQQLTPYISYSGGGRRLSMKATKIL